MAEHQGLMGGLESLTKDPKATEDLSKEADELIPKAEAQAKAGSVQSAIDEILTLEKRARQACDAITTSRLVLCLIGILRSHEDWTQINEYIVMLPKRRGQLKRVIIDMVQKAMSWLEETPDKATKLSLIDTLSQVTQGKIFVEVERARLIQVLARIKEADGEVEEAAALMQEVQVETFGAMERREKTEYILDQMRLVTLRGDFVRVHIISKKINSKLLESEDFQDLKLQYNALMVQYHRSEGQYLDVCKCYLSVFHTPSVQAEPAKWQEALQAYTLYVALAPFDKEQNDMLRKLQETEKKKLTEIPIFKKLVDDLLTLELISWPLPERTVLEKHAVFQDSPLPGGAERWTLLRTRIMQHNIKVLAEYYDRLPLERVASLLQVDRAEAESHISELVTSKFLHAKMDRPAGIVVFTKVHNENDKLDAWSGDINKLLDLVEETCHLVAKEKMVHAARAKRRQLEARE